MKIRITNKEHKNFGQVFRVLKMNSSSILIDIDNKKTLLDNENVEIIPENMYEETIYRHKDVLKIKLNKGISITFYTVILEFIKNKIGEDIFCIDVLKDGISPIRKNMYEKTLLLLINDIYPLKVSTIGTKYSNEYKVTIKDVFADDFIEQCTSEVQALEKDIEEKTCVKEQCIKSIEKIINYDKAGTIEKKIIKKGESDIWMPVNF
ncbi:MAG: hypothetical protein Q8936_20240 [Bacillota bacterium]|nr:hypothetical protein [Bacillota bacterium]